MIDPDDGVPLFVLHDVGDETGGTAWQRAFELAGWPGPVLAPSLPGHGDRPAPVGGSYELADAALVAVRELPELSSGDRHPVVVGVGLNGWSAEILALADRAAGLVLVDGLSGPWSSPASAIGAGRAWLRALAADPAAIAPPPPGALDPRLRHGLLPHADRRLAERAAATLSVPVLVIESRHSPLTHDEAVDLAARIAISTLIELPAPTPGGVADAAVSWWSTRGRLRHA